MHKQMPGAAPRVLDMQLRELERAGIVQKTTLGTFPLHTEYTLTEVGKSILPIVHAMDAWGTENKTLFAEAGALLTDETVL